VLGQEVHFRRLDGSQGVVRANAAPIRGPDGEILGGVTVYYDITQEKAFEEQLREENRINETLHRLGASFATELDEQKLLQLITDEATSLTGAQFGSFFFNVVDARGESYMLYTLSGVDRSHFEKFPMPRNTAIFSPTFAGTGVLRLDDVTKDPRYGKNPPYHGMPKGHLPVRSYLAVPVIGREGVVLGGLFFGHSQAGVFTDRHELLASGVAGWAAIALDNARLYQEAAEANRLKDEFLATLSHELRTPLNSMLILSKLVSQNSEGNLTPKQVEYAKTIHSSGADLLALINDILDLAKIESGTMDLDVSEVSFLELRDFVERTFRQLAQSKGLDFDVLIDPKLPEVISTDSKRLQQVLQNLLSNAFKFTERGGITLRIEEVTQGWSPNQVTLNRASGVVAFSVTDTGIGIPADRHKVIFESFQQADGTTSRKYGGTGLGLSISRGNAGLLGGEIRLISSPGEGSTFTLYLPLTYSPGVPRPSRSYTEGTTPDVLRRVTQRSKGVETAPAAFLQNEIEDDRGEIKSGDRVLLLIEDDVAFARILLDLVRQRGFKGLVALRGEAGLELAREFKPDAITLDIELPDMDGWSVLERLKDDLSLRHIPVQIISVSEERQRGLKSGAVAYLNKPVTQEALAEAISDIKGFIERRLKNLLVVEDDEVQRNSIVELIGNGDVHTVAVGSGVEALARLKEEQFQCMVLDLGLPDMTGFELIERIQKEIGLLELPIIVYTGRELTKKDETELRRVADTIIIKDVKSLARLLDETSLFLHRVEGELPESKRRMLQQLHQTDTVLAGKKVVIIDDDIRNIFALTSVLENHQMQVLYAENGRDGLELLQNTPGIDVALVDIMMPEMDGYEAMQHIRDMPEFKSVPLIALTAKAMKGDREKCIEAGASDYITKPADSEQLLSLLRVWLFK